VGFFAAEWAQQPDAIEVGGLDVSNTVPPQEIDFQIANAYSGSLGHVAKCIKSYNLEFNG
jgi:hypothetical protein